MEHIKQVNSESEMETRKNDQAEKIKEIQRIEMKMQGMQAGKSNQMLQFGKIVGVPMIPSTIKKQKYSEREVLVMQIRERGKEMLDLMKQAEFETRERKIHVEVHQKQTQDRKILWNDLDSDEKSRVKEAKVNFQGRIISFETFACNNEEMYAALSHSEIATLLEGKELRIGEEIKPKAKHLIERKFQKVRCKDDADFFDSDDHDEEEKRNGKKDIGKKDEGFHSRSNGNTSRDNGASFNGGGGGGSNDGNDDDQKKNDKQKSEPFEEPNDSEILSLDELMMEAKEQKVVSISDEPGAGCSTVLETIGAKIIKEWMSVPLVLLIDLWANQWPLRCDIFDSIAECSPPEIVEKAIEVLKKFQEVPKLVELKLRLEFQKSNVVFLWDGIDKDVKSFSGFLTFLKRVKDTNNIQFVTANRYVKEIETALGVKSFRMVPLSNDDIKFFVEKYTLNLNILPAKNENFLNAHQRFHEILRNPQILKAFVEVYSKDNAFDASNLYDVLQKIIANLSTKVCGINIFQCPMFLEVHQAVAIENAIGESFEDITNVGKAIKVKELQIFKCHSWNFAKYFEKKIIYRFYYKEGNNYFFHQKFIACFFVAHYILTSVLFLDKNPSDLIIRHKLLFFIANHDDEHINLIKALVVHGIKTINVEDNDKNPYNYEIIRNNFPCLFKHFNFNTSAIDFLSECFKHDRKMLLHFWNIGNRNSLALKASQNQGWNKEEIFALAQKYFDTKELLTFEEELNYGFEIINNNANNTEMLPEIY